MYSEYSAARNAVDIRPYVRDIIVNQAGGGILSNEDVKELMLEDGDIVEENVRPTIIGYPTRPLYRELAERLQDWLETKKCPMLDLPNFDLLDEKLYIQNRTEMIGEISPMMERIRSLYSLWTEDELRSHITDILRRLGRRGLLDLLGLRKTVGSSDFWPPPRKILEKTFCEKHSPDTDSILTVGARALTKHSHRDMSSSWWGVCTGSEKAKNDHAYEKMKIILNNALWINIHQLPHDVKIIEARQENGYGVRWTSDGKQFRGFLEPQMVDGHEVGWRH